MGSWVFPGQWESSGGGFVGSGGNEGGMWQTLGVWVFARIRGPFSERERRQELGPGATSSQASQTPLGLDENTEIQFPEG